MTHPLHRLGAVALCLGLFTACGESDVPDGVLVGDDGEHDTFLDPSGKADAFGVKEKTPEALGILRLVNEASPSLLTDEAGVSPRSAQSIVSARVGKDKKLFSHDDKEVVTLAKLDAIPWVGAKTFSRLQVHANANGFVQPWKLRYPEPSRLVAVGDVHGDVDAARTALEIAGAIDGGDNWIGGDMVVVQLGDVLDRGDGEKEILDLFAKLVPQAEAAGGRFIMLLGNHELMNADLDLSYVTPVGFSAFEGIPGLDLSDPRVTGLPVKQRARAAAFMQGGPYARKLAEHNTIVIVGDTLFVHGGILPKHVSYGLDAINYDAKAFLLWNDLSLPAILDAEDSPVWYRGYGEPADTNCTTLHKTLKGLGISRMVVAHTPQLDGITTDCNDQLFRADVGMSSYYGGPVEVLEIIGSDVWTITAQ